uniref:DUF6598 domain-containing protein n=1 Tax=Aegilops tauschii TaxID=37682 RepID=M8BMJ7_AEGTA
MVDALGRYRETLRWETGTLRSEATSRGLETIAGKKDYLNRHHPDGRSLSLESPQLVDQNQKVASLPLVSLPYLVANQEEALALLLHEALKLGYRVQSLRELATLSPMYFTPFAPGIIPYSGFATKALQIYSFKIFDLDDSLKWPLYVYGVVAARDAVDGNHNLLFSRSRTNCQLLTEKDPFLHLTGPSRAILAEYPVDFEVELRIKDGAEPQDKALMSSTNHHHFGGAIAAACRQVVLLDSVQNFPEDGLDGYLPLSRNVVTVESKGSLRIIMKGYSKSGIVADEARLDFPAQDCQISTQECTIGNAKLQVVIAWSLLVRDKLDNLAEGIFTRGIQCNDLMHKTAHKNPRQLASSLTSATSIGLARRPFAADPEVTRGRKSKAPESCKPKDRTESSNKKNKQQKRKS